MKTWTLVYDGRCGFCRGTVAWLARRDRRGRLRFVPSQDRDALAALPPLSPEALNEAMHLVAPDGGVTAGAVAARQILRLLPWGRPLAALFRVPGVPALAARAYRAVARNRYCLAFGAPARCAPEALKPGLGEDTLRHAPGETTR